jgi:hypothetical protein
VGEPGINEGVRELLGVGELVCVGELVGVGELVCFGELLFFLHSDHAPTTPTTTRTVARTIFSFFFILKVYKLPLYFNYIGNII